MMKKLAGLLFLVASTASAQVWIQLPEAWAQIGQTGIVVPVGYLTITNDDVPVTQRAIINIVGGGCVDDAVNFSTDCTFAGGAGGYATIDNEGTPLTQRATINFIGAGVDCVDDAGGSETDCTIAGSAGAPTTVDYLVGTADGGLSAEIVVGTTPGGELGNTWASPTLDDGITVTGWTSINTDTSWNAKGDLMAATANNAAAAVTVGSNDTVLIADSVQSTGVAWTTLPTASYTNDSVTLAKIANAAANSVLVGSGSAGTGTNYTEITLGTGMAMTGTVLSATAGAANPATTGAILFDEFDTGIVNPTSVSLGSRYGFSVTNTNGAGDRPASTDGNHPGIAAVTSTTNVAGKSIMRSTNIAAITLNGGEIYEALVQVTDVSHVTNPTYTARIGLGDNSASALSATTDGVYFEHRSTSANWIVATDSTSGGLTETDTGTAVVADTWTKLRWVANSDATSIEFFINGASVATHTTDIPTASGEAAGFIFGIDKTQGAIDAGFWVDYIYFDYGTLTR